MQAVAIRLTPQQDLKQELDQFVIQQGWTAACILTGVGSLNSAVLRLAGQPTDTHYPGPFEIVSLTGVMSIHGTHYHIALADPQGQVIGGHVLNGCLIYTTAEIVIGVLPHLTFRREPDAMTGYKELTIEAHERS